MKRIGAHVSAAGGVDKAPGNAVAIGAKAFALFTKNQRQWQAPPLTEAQVTAFRANLGKGGFLPCHVLPHDSYLINLGHPRREEREKSWAAFAEEMKRCEVLGLDRLNFHPGAHLGEVSEEECLLRIAEGVSRALDQTRGVVAVIENTAGQGTQLGFRFEHLARIIAEVALPERIGVCLDTCHLFTSGYDLRTEQDYDRTMAEFEAVVGFRYLKGMHLNDSKPPLGARVDRHASLGMGHLGWEPFGRMVRDPRLEEIPLILETVDETLWPEEIRRLYALAEG
ncbi:MAG: deoxyribonuclease IV [Magnetococcales bacterium]|nr:deoxyribonuclease IV [Magnetococcales bacterium]